MLIKDNVLRSTIRLFDSKKDDDVAKLWHKCLTNIEFKTNSYILISKIFSFIGIKILNKFIAAVISIDIYFFHRKLRNFSCDETVSVIQKMYIRYFKELQKYIIALNFTNAIKFEDINYKNKFCNEGIVTQSGNKDDLDFFHNLFRDEIEKTLERKKDRGLRDYDSAEVIDGNDPRLKIITEKFDQKGLLEEANEFLGYKPNINKVVVHRSRFGDKHHDQTATDLERTKTNNLHFDPKLGRIKSIVYLGILPTNHGNFQYLPKTHKINQKDITKLLMAKAFSISNYINTPNEKKVFASLKNEYKVSAIFGSLLQEYNDLQDILLENIDEIIGEDYVTYVLFDPNGIHRGGIINEEGKERLNLQVFIGPKEDNKLWNSLR